MLGLILATGAFLIIRGGSKHEEATPVADSETSETQTASANGSFNGSLADLAMRGGSHKCTFMHSTDVSDSSGTLFISGKKMRGDFKTHEKVNGTDIESHMLSDGSFAYVWSPAMPSGMKMQTELTAATPGSTTSANFDYSQKLDYQCEAWTADEATFALPANVTFMELPTA